jgi:hypothetical protein
MKMDVSGYLDSGFLKVEHIQATGPRRCVVAAVKPGKFERPDMEFQDGSMLSLNATNMKILAVAYGVESDDWIGKEVELFIGKTEFQGQPRDSVLIKPISPVIPASERKKPTPRPAGVVGGIGGRRGDMDDEIPFAAAWV